MNEKEIRQKIFDRIVRIDDQKVSQSFEDSIIATVADYIKSKYPPIKRNITVDPCLSEEEKNQGKINFIIS